MQKISVLERRKNIKKIICLSSGEDTAIKQEKVVVIAELRQRYPLIDLLKLSGVARSTFYYYLKSKDIDKYKEDMQSTIKLY